jgi:hypothetical protein
MELVLASLIASMVMGIVTVALSFSIRMWERRHNQNPPQVYGVLDLMKWQLASFDPSPVKVDDEAMPLFQGEESSLTFATDKSVKAISKGAPVVARYVYVPNEKILYYAEIPFDPYHPKRIQEFIDTTPGKGESGPLFYAVNVASFALSYAGEEKGVNSNSWNEDSAAPSAVIVKWSPDDGTSMATSFIIPNFLFPKAVAKKKPQQQGLPGFDED